MHSRPYAGLSARAYLEEIMAYSAVLRAVSRNQTHCPPGCEGELCAKHAGDKTGSVREERRPESVASDGGVRLQGLTPQSSGIVTEEPRAASEAVRKVADPLFFFVRRRQRQLECIRVSYVRKREFSGLGFWFLV